MPKPKTIRPPRRSSHLPMGLATALAEAARRRRTYADVGHHLAQHIEHVFDADDVREMATLDVGEEELARPTRTVRQIVASERHPDGTRGESIPPGRRRTLRDGMRGEAGGDECSEGRRRYTR